MIRYSFFVLIILLSCANRGALTGGEADKIPPEIVFSDPGKDTTGVSMLPTFYFEFSERVNRNSFESSVFTIPIQKRRIKYDWNGWDEVTLQFIDTIKDMKTYQLVVSKAYKDEHGVQASKEYKIAFTRDSKLDRDFIKGRLQLKNDIPNLKAALFDQDFQIQYVGDLSDENIYHLEFLKQADYRLVFFEDKDANLKIDFEKEQVAIPQSDYLFNDQRGSTDAVYFFKTDTIAPVISEVDSVRKGIFYLSIEDELDVVKTRLYLEDTTGTKTPVYRILKKGNRYFAYYQATDYADKYVVKFDNIEDIYGNRRDSIKQFIEFAASQSIDTIPFKITSINLRNNDSFKSLLPNIKIKMNTMFVWDPIWNSRIRLTSQGEELELMIKQDQPDEINIQPLDELKPSRKYEFRFESTGIHNVFNSSLKDSTYMYSVYSQSRNRFGSLTFQLNTKSSDPIRYRLFKLEKPDELFKTGALKSNAENTIDNIEGGLYKMEFYQDRNRNNSLDFGSFRPYILSEPIQFIKDSIPVRSNWDRVIQDINFD